MGFEILEEIWFGNLSDEAARKTASASLAARTAKLHGLRPFPVAAQRLLQMTSTDDYKVSEVAELIESDPALATRLLRVVNSAASGLTRSCRSVQSAVTLLGQRALRQTALTASVVLAYGGDDERTEKVLEHSAIVAALCRELARTARLPPDEMYTCGLLHDIGKLMFLQSGDASYGELLDSCGPQQGALHAKECEQFGFDHAILAGQMLADWRIPEPIPVVVGWHHNLKRATEAEPSIASMIHLIHLADALSRHVEAEQTEEFFEQHAASHDAIALGISAALLEGTWQRMGKVARSSVNSLLGKTDDDPQETEGKPDAADGKAPESARKAGGPHDREAPVDQVCALCGEASFGSTCTHCHALLCPAHEPRAGELCARCEQSFRKAERTSTAKLGGAAGFLGVLVVAAMLAGVLHARGIANVAQVAPVGLLAAFLTGLAMFAWVRWTHRARFLRHKKP